MNQNKNFSPEKIISIDEVLVQSQVSKMVARRLKIHLNTMLEVEAGRLVGAQRYERTGAL